MMDKERLKKMGKRFFIWILKEQKFIKFEALYHRVDVILIKYIKGNLIEALAVGGINAILMLINEPGYTSSHASIRIGKVPALVYV